MHFYSRQKDKNYLEFLDRNLSEAFLIICLFQLTFDPKVTMKFVQGQL